MAFIDNFTSKMMFAVSMKEEIILHSNDLQRWMDNNANLSDHPLLWHSFFNDPALGVSIIESEKLDNQEKTDDLIDWLVESSKIVLVLGKRRHGKTALAFFLAEEIHRKYPGKPICAIETIYSSELPAYITQITSIYDAPEGSIVIYDEASITLNARDSMTKEAKDNTSLMAISGHQGLTLLYLSQHSQIADVNILRLADGFLFKPLSWEETEGKQDKTIGTFIKFLKLMQPKTKGETLFTDGEKWHLIRTELPTFWSDTLSKSYKKLTRDDAIKMGRNMLEKGIRPRVIVKELKIRGIDWTEEDLIYFTGYSRRKKKARH